MFRISYTTDNFLKIDGSARITRMFKGLKRPRFLYVSRGDDRWAFVSRLRRRPAVYADFTYKTNVFWILRHFIEQTPM